MRDKITAWAMVAVVGFIALALLARHVNPPKARAQRISTVNHLSSVSLTLTNASPLPAGQPGTNK
ncbi:MAG: hypothetical protein ACLQU3_08055 [Limisphaerales bacterium]